MKLFCKLIIAGALLSLQACEIKSHFDYLEFDYNDFRYYELPMGEFPVGFHAELHWDESRSFNGMDKRPLLVGLWYPAEPTDRSRQLTYQDYLMANSQHDGVSINDTTAAWIEGAYVAGAQTAFNVNKDDVPRLMDMPVRAFEEAKAISGSHPLLLYAASFNAGIHENAALWEYLASQGFVVAAIASVGHDSPAMTADSLGIAAQLADFRMLYDIMMEHPQVNDKRVATAGFSWGGFPATLLGLEKEVQLIISMDGSHTYFPEAVQKYKGIYDLPAKGAYIQLSQRMPENAPFKQDTMVYHWMGQSADAYYFQYKAMDHRDFGGNFQHFNALANDSAFRAAQAQRHKQVYSKDVKGQGYLKTAEIISQAFGAYLNNFERSKTALGNQPDSLFTIKRKHLPR